MIRGIQFESKCQRTYRITQVFIYLHITFFFFFFICKEESLSEAAGAASMDQIKRLNLKNQTF